MEAIIPWLGYIASAMVTALASALIYAVTLHSEIRRLRGERNLLQLSMNHLQVENALLKVSSERDPLTGLLNRRGGRLALDALKGPATTPMGVLVLDIDHFKIINDRYGHPMGDEVLREVARRIKAEMQRDEDIAARWGGEEVLVVLPGTTKEGSLTVAERLHKAIAAPISLADKTVIKVTVSIGVYVIPQGENGNFDNALKEADKALYKAKESGRNRVILSEAA